VRQQGHAKIRVLRPTNLLFSSRQNAQEEGVAKALEKTYDGIIIGAGHHGLILGSYLAKAGLSVLLVDRRLQYGGGLSTQEVTAPGFHQSVPHFRDSVVQGPRS
jgi:heterodisulfide reductase subunit A-like polyferredoxin